MLQTLNIQIPAIPHVTINPFECCQAFYHRKRCKLAVSPTIIPSVNFLFSVNSLPARPTTLMIFHWNILLGR